jgi:hypothetical protein
MAEAKCESEWIAWKDKVLEPVDEMKEDVAPYTLGHVTVGGRPPSTK